MAPCKKSWATNRLNRDHINLKKDPVPHVVAEPNPSNILEWYYVIIGPEGSPYAGGYYLGRLLFYRDDPFKPPIIYMNTPNGRFKTNIRLCLSFSDDQPYLWNPAWSVSTILSVLLSFMLEDIPIKDSIEMTDDERRQLADQSLESIIRDENFCELFPELAMKIQNEIENRNLARDNEEESPSMYSSQPENNNLDVYSIVVVFGIVLFIYLVRYLNGY